MTYRRIAAFPFVWAGLFLLVLLVLPEASRTPVYFLEIDASKALAAVGCFVAAYTFERGDYMRRAWTFSAWCYLLLLLRDLLLASMAATATLPAGITPAAIEGALALLANVSSVIGTWLLARAWSIAGLELPGSRAARTGVVLVAAGFAFGVSGSDLWVDGSTLLHGNFGALHSVASDLGDVFALCLLAPLVLTVIGMSGGVLKWPWGLLTACLVFWLMYDATTTLAHIFPGHEETAHLARETFRALACACECAAGLAQRRVVTAPAEAEAD